MRSRGFGVFLLILSAAGVGCGEGAPPFDELPLRDALSAGPDALAAMPAPARARLAARFEAGRTSDAASDEVGRAPALPFALATTVDEARQRRQADALIVGAIAGGVARPISAVRDGESALPPLESAGESATASLESAALQGAARPPLLALLAASDARRLERVTSWPVGAVAIDDTIYVNAAWLVALVPAGAGGVDGGAPLPSPSERAIPSVPPAPQDRAEATPDGDVGPAEIEARSSALSWGTPDGGAQTYAPDLGCQASCDADESDDASCDDGGDDSCSGSSDDGGDACGAADDGGDACGGSPDVDPSGCQIAGRLRGRGRPRGRDWSWLMAPLAFLLLRRRA